MSKHYEAGAKLSRPRELTAMRNCNRRTFALISTGGLLALLAARQAQALTDRERFFIAEAARMRREAIAAGDQAFGAVMVRDNEIIGWGPSRVVTEANSDAHAERVALWDAQRRLGSKHLAGAVIYSTSRPCSVCQAALAAANVASMRHGPDATDAGKPQRR